MSNPRRRPKDEGIVPSHQSLQFSARNLAFGLGGLASLVLGYWLLANGSITLAPVLLVLGYVVLIPLALIL
jgi:hypothetical protein